MSLPTDAVQLPAQFGRYRIVRKLGQGGMGAVYLAHDTRLDRQVALKVCTLADNPAALVRFQREAKVAALLRHPNICPVHDYDVHDGTAYITMAYIEGEPLHHWLANHSLSAREAALAVRKLAMAMHKAHKAGVVHRDLKPSNIIVDRDGELIILDFGLARLMHDATAYQAKPGVPHGTPSYMAPEQAQGSPEAIKPAVDVYALGVVLYELLAGEPPFVGPPNLVVAQVVAASPKPPCDLNPAVPDALNAICLRALAKKPEDRPESMKAFADDLTQIIRTLPATPIARPTVTSSGSDNTARILTTLATRALTPPYPDRIDLDLGGVTLELLRIDPGRTRMGSTPAERERVMQAASFQPTDEREHLVAITRPFFLGRFTVTQEQYSCVTAKPNPSWFGTGGGGEVTLRNDFAELDTRRFPVENLSWEDAVSFCDELMRRHGDQLPGELRQAGYRFALPTEAQWEYACRAGTITAFHFGDSLNGTAANCNGNYPFGTDDKGPCLDRTAEVGQYAANRWGLHDMHGNVWQWCADVYDADFYNACPIEDPFCREKPGEERRVVRGGSWNNVGWGCRAAYRMGLAPGNHHGGLGFRVCLRQD
jgi:serine/threonine protein kinase